MVYLHVRETDPLSALPSLDSSDLKAVDPAVVSYWRVSAALTSAAIFVGFAVYAVPALYFAPKIGVGLLVAATLTSTPGLLFALVTSSMRYRRLAYSTDHGVLRLRYGVLVHTEKVIPTRRLQHIDIDRGPVERWFGLVSLSVFTAGGRRATFSLPGLSPQTAEALRAQLVQEAFPVTTDDR